MEGEGRTEAVLLPGAVLPADLAYGALLEELGPEVEAVPKELEVYAGERPPAGYTLVTEGEGIERTAAAAGFDRFHLVGYSAGGAAAIAFAARRPERLRSLTLLEPAWAGNEGRGAAEEALWREMERIVELPPEQMMPAFVRAQLAPGVEPPPPPPGPPPPWMEKRPAGLRAITAAFAAEELDAEALRRLEIPVYFALGGRSNPDHYARIADRLSRLVDDFTLEVFEERHHFDPPHRVEPGRLAASLRAFWTRAGAAADGPRVELLWWAGCPSWEEAGQIVREEMAAAGIDPGRLEIREIATDEGAEREGFVGSPTIRVDGRDLQDPGGEPAGLTCRVYRLRDGRISALPDPADVRDALRAAGSVEQGSDERGGRE